MMHMKRLHTGDKVFMLPSDTTGKKSTEETNRLLKLWNQDSPLNAIALKNDRFYTSTVEVLLFDE